MATSQQTERLRVSEKVLVEINREVPRSALRYFGGKWALAPWIIGHMPEHRVYVEPFGGAASVLLRKPRSKIEIYNDLDDEIVGLFRILQNPTQCQTLVRVLKRTPYARREFELAFRSTDDPLERARQRLERASYANAGAGAQARMEVLWMSPAR